MSNPFDAFDSLDAALANFDVDKAVQQHLSRTATALQTSTNADQAAPQKQAAKKQKVAHSDDSSLCKTLQNVFGYPSFRDGQLDVIQAILRGQDVSVYWATGKGKSLCYQIPALHLNQVALVVSPLISLMQDQCHKLNALSEGKPYAAFLGSAQTDRLTEDKAWKGEFALVYLTPEKLVISRDRIALLHASHKQIAVIAIDEAHTVSEWGTDFRADFRKLSCLRDDTVLRDIPILTLTATAVPRVQRDITSVLQLRQPFLSQQSLDRKNLRLVIRAKPSNPLSAFQGYLKLWNDPAVRPSQHSTIVYVATRKEVETMAATLGAQVTNPAITVGAYHAGLSAEERKLVHTAFLTGQCTILVATVAFGMGIDKPDTRRIVHYGPPKTMEEYYQQVGRAGRDGGAAEAVLFMTSSDFNKYQDDFYVGNLPPDARTATLESLQALKNYCVDKTQCRRKSLLTYFGERPAFSSCHNCDVCQQTETFGNDVERDFRDLGALLLLKVIDGLNEQPLGQIMAVISGKRIEAYRCRVPVGTLQDSVQRAIADFPRKFTRAYFEQLLGAMQQRNLVLTKQVNKSVDGRSRSWSVYCLTPIGRRVILSEKEPIKLPVPEFLRDMERKEEERRQKILDDLHKSNFKERIPSEELQKGDGEVIRAYHKWQTYVEKARGLGKSERADQLELLLSSIERWRSKAAAKLEVAPVSVIPEHVMVSIAYAVATLPPGSKMDAAALKVAGVRSREIDSLTCCLGEWVEKCQPALDLTNSTADTPVKLGLIPVRTPWKYAVYKPQRKTGKATFEISYDRYARGESIQSIAMNQEGKKLIQAKTVAGHILEAIIHGKAVDPGGIVSILPLPTRDEWQKLETSHDAGGLDPVGDPETSGANNGRYTQTDAIRSIIPNVVAIPSDERTESDRAILGHWYDRLRWFLALKRGGIQPALG